MVGAGNKPTVKGGQGPRAQEAGRRHCPAQQWWMHVRQGRIGRPLNLGIISTLGHMVLCEEGCPVCCRMFNIPGLQPSDTSSTSSPSVTTQNISGRCQYPLGGKMTRAENCEKAEGFHWDRELQKGF